MDSDSLDAHRDGLVANDRALRMQYQEQAPARHVEALELRNAELRAIIQRQRGELRVNSAMIDDQTIMIHGLRERAATLESQISGLLGSRSWKLTAPIRGASTVLRRIVRR